MKLRYIAAACTLALAPTAAQANDFLGPRIGIVGGWDSVSHEIDEIDFDESTSGATFGIVTGYHFPLGEGAIFGIGTSTMFSSADKTFTSGADTLEIEAKRDLEIHAKIGAIVAPSALIFAKVGYANAKVKASGTIGGTDFSESETGSGLRLGVGTEILVGGPVSLTAEYRYSNYGSGFSRNQIVGGVLFSF